MAMAKLPVLLTQGEDGYVVARIPATPSCISQGRTLEKALASFREAALLPGRQGGGGGKSCQVEELALLTHLSGRDSLRSLYMMSRGVSLYEGER